MGFKLEIVGVELQKCKEKPYISVTKTSVTEMQEKMTKMHRAPKLLILRSKSLRSYGSLRFFLEIRKSKIPMHFRQLSHHSYGLTDLSL